MKSCAFDSTASTRALRKQEAEGNKDKNRKPAKPKRTQAANIKHTEIAKMKAKGTEEALENEDFPLIRTSQVNAVKTKAKAKKASVAKAKTNTNEESAVKMRTNTNEASVAKTTKSKPKVPAFTPIIHKEDMAQPEGTVTKLTKPSLMQPPPALAGGLYKANKF